MCFFYSFLRLDVLLSYFYQVVLQRLSVYNNALLPVKLKKDNCSPSRTLVLITITQLLSSLLHFSSHQRSSLQPSPYSPLFISSLTPCSSPSLWLSASSLHFLSLHPPLLLFSSQPSLFTSALHLSLPGLPVRYTCLILWLVLFPFPCLTSHPTLLFFFVLALVGHTAQPHLRPSQSSLDLTDILRSPSSLPHVVVVHFPLSSPYPLLMSLLYLVSISFYKGSLWCSGSTLGLTKGARVRFPGVG